ncbi:unnamed protein product [Candidula unifasciata]|uniref:Transcription factor CBF/NF-Y/archaeal histone domain-containing protein n=1 Tax=Candidula unifasciata TaxID=100452 RepID=A0A8S3YIY0_9EUPU|nr:unnamed protein product [Candidula unifasciata]
MAGLEDMDDSLQLDVNEVVVPSAESEHSRVSQQESEAERRDAETEPQEKLIKLPLTRIRSIMKTDPDVKIASQDAVITLAKAAELFIQGLAREAAMRTIREKRKIVLRKHLDDVFETKDNYSFLEGVLESFED